MKWNPAAFLTTLAVTAVLALALGLAQDRGVLFRASFDTGLDADQAAGEVAALAEGVSRQPISDLADNRGAVLRASSVLHYPASGNVLPESGTLELDLQPLGNLMDGKNHFLFAWGDPDAPNSLVLWKTAQHNDLRLRVGPAEGRRREVASPDCSRWLAGTWHQLVATWDFAKGDLRLFIDGALAGSTKLAGVRFTPTGDRFWIGSIEGGTQGAECVIDDVTLSRGAKPPARIQRDYERFLAAERTGFAGAGVRPTSMALVPKPDSTFAVVTDTHISEAGAHGRYSHNHRVAELHKQLNALKPDFVVNCGDIVTGFPGHANFLAQYKEAVRLLKQIEAPNYVTAGNHDVGNKLQLTYAQKGSKTPEAAARARGWFVNEDNLALYREYFGKDFYSFDHEGCHFVVTNNALFNSGLPSEKQQWTWLLADLEKAKGSRLIFMFMHNPMFWVGADDEGWNNYENISEPARSELLKLYAKYNVKVAFTGHTHHALSNTYQGTRFLTLPSTTFARNFANNYGIPNLNTPYDPARVGFYICRVYGEDVQINEVRTFAPLPPKEQLQEGNDAPQERLLTKLSAELQGSVIALKSAEPPPVKSPQWSVALAIDGVTGYDVPAARIGGFGWTSAPHADDDQEEWISVELPESVRATKLELWPRPGFRGFPTSFAVETGGDGATWEVIKRFGAFRPERDQKLLTLDLPGSAVSAVRVSITGMPPMFQGRRASIMELRVLDAAGTNHASADGGAVAKSKTSASGNRRIVDDQAWHAPHQVGAKWVRIPARHAGWEVIERSEGHLALPYELSRAMDMGCPPGVSFLWPVTVANVAYKGASPAQQGAAWRRYVAFLAEALRGRVAGWELVVPEGAPSDAVQQWLTELSKVTTRGKARPLLVLSGVDLAATGKLTLSQAGAVIMPVQTETRPEVALADVAAWSAQLQERHAGTRLWLALSGWQGESFTDLERAKCLARAALLTRAAGAQLLWDLATPERGAILSRTFVPTASYYASRTLNTVLPNGARLLPEDRIGLRASRPGVEVQTYAVPNGDRLIALWQPIDASRPGEPILCQLTLPNADPGSVRLIDPLRCTSQTCDSRVESNAVVIDKLRVGDYPLLVHVGG